MAYTIEEAKNDSDLRWSERLFQRTISDLGQHVVGTVALRLRKEFDGLLLLARSADRKVLGALNSHAPYQVADGVEQMAGPMMGDRLRNETRLLEHLAVDPDHRRAGIAGDLIDQAGKSHAARGIQLWFGFLDDRDDGRGVRAFYEAAGFHFAATPHELPDPASAVAKVASSRRGIWFWRDLRAYQS